MIVGLGNPGPKYAGTRHNVGFDVVDRLAARWRVDFSVEKFHAWFGSVDVFGERVVLLKPTTWMNRSGQSVLAAGRFYKLDLADMIVIADDLALPLGRLRMRRDGSSGGHNGLGDVMERIGSDAWCRLRVGIGEPLGDPATYVLRRFGDKETPVIEAAVKSAADAIECWIREGPSEAMNQYNGDPPGLDSSDT